MLLMTATIGGIRNREDQKVYPRFSKMTTPRYSFVNAFHYSATNQTLEYSEVLVRKAKKETHPYCLRCGNDNTGLVDDSSHIIFECPNETRMQTRNTLKANLQLAVLTLVRAPVIRDLHQGDPD